MELNNIKALPADFILDITHISGSSDDVCLKAIEHYKRFLNNPDPVVISISQAMVGNLTEYYSLSHIGSPNFELALPHLSEMASFMDSKNTIQMDVESTARIKSFYSLYEKLLMECSEHLERNYAIPTSGLAYDIIATRDVMHPRYQFRFEPENFYRHVYGLILEYMEHINELSKTDSRYGFKKIPHKKQLEIIRPKVFDFDPPETFSVPDKDFVAYALDIKGIPQIYRYITSLSSSMSKEDIYREIEKLRSTEDNDELFELPIVKALKSQIQKESVISFRNSLERELLSIMSSRKKMLQDYKKLSEEDFLYIYGKSLYPEYRDFIRIINYLDIAIQNDHYDLYLDFDRLITGGEISEQVICNRLEYQLGLQKLDLESRIGALRFEELGDFSQNFDQASLINYFSSCSKDYMRNPKSSGYQSFHIIVETPFGSYEKQFRTATQNDLAEHGNASHSNSYKPYEKQNFHRLKVCTPLMPARDEKGDIISPIQLEPIDFASAIKAYYHQGFEFFSGGLTLDEFRKKHPDDFDEAFLELSNSNTSEGMIDRISSAFEFLRTFDFFKRFGGTKTGAKFNHKISLVKKASEDCNSSIYMNNPKPPIMSSEHKSSDTQSDRNERS